LRRGQYPAQGANLCGTSNAFREWALKIHAKQYINGNY